MGGPDRNIDSAQTPQNAQEPNRNDKEPLSFEQIVDQLSSIVTQLEDGELPLEQALLTFERGVALSRLGSKRLDEAERRIEILLDDSETRDSVETRPFAAELDDE